MLSSSWPPESLVTRTARDPGDRIRSVAATEPMALPPGGSIIGLVRFTTHRGERAEAILDAEGRWRCPELPVLDRVLNILFEPRREAAGASPFGHDALDRVAAWIKGTVQLRPTGVGFPPGGAR